MTKLPLLPSKYGSAEEKAAAKYVWKAIRGAPIPAVPDVQTVEGPRSVNYTENKDINTDFVQEFAQHAIWQALKDSGYEHAGDTPHLIESIINEGRNPVTNFSSALAAAAYMCLGKVQGEFVDEKKEEDRVKEAATKLAPLYVKQRSTVSKEDLEKVLREAIDKGAERLKAESRSKPPSNPMALFSDENVFSDDDTRYGAVIQRLGYATPNSINYMSEDDAATKLLHSYIVRWFIALLQASLHEIEVKNINDISAYVGPDFKPHEKDNKPSLYWMPFDGTAQKASVYSQVYAAVSMFFHAMTYIEYDPLQTGDSDNSAKAVIARRCDRVILMALAQKKLGEACVFFHTNASIPTSMKQLLLIPCLVAHDVTSVWGPKIERIAKWIDVDGGEGGIQSIARQLVIPDELPLFGDSLRAVQTAANRDIRLYDEFARIYSSPVDKDGNVEMVPDLALNPLDDADAEVVRATAWCAVFNGPLVDRERNQRVTSAQKYASAAEYYQLTNEKNLAHIKQVAITMDAIVRQEAFDIVKNIRRPALLKIYNNSAVNKNTEISEITRSGKQAVKALYTGREAHELTSYYYAVAAGIHAAADAGMHAFAYPHAVHRLLCDVGANELEYLPPKSYGVNTTEYWRQSTFHHMAARLGPLMYAGYNGDVCVHPASIDVYTSTDKSGNDDSSSVYQMTYREPRIMWWVFSTMQYIASNAEFAGLQHIDSITMDHLLDCALVMAIDNSKLATMVDAQTGKGALFIERLLSQCAESTPAEVSLDHIAVMSGIAAERKNIIGVFPSRAVLTDTFYLKAESWAHSVIVNNSASGIEAFTDFMTVWRFGKPEADTMLRGWHLDSARFELALLCLIICWAEFGFLSDARNPSPIAVEEGTLCKWRYKLFGTLYHERFYFIGDPGTKKEPAPYHYVPNGFIGWFKQHHFPKLCAGFSSALDKINTQFYVNADLKAYDEDAAKNIVVQVQVQGQGQGGGRGVGGGGEDDGEVKQPDGGDDEEMPDAPFTKGLLGEDLMSRRSIQRAATMAMRHIRDRGCDLEGGQCQSWGLYEITHSKQWSHMQAQLDKVYIASASASTAKGIDPQGLMSIVKSSWSRTHPLLRLPGTTWFSSALHAKASTDKDLAAEIREIESHAVPNAAELYAIVLQRWRGVPPSVRRQLCDMYSVSNRKGVFWKPEVLDAMVSVLDFDSTFPGGVQDDRARLASTASADLNTGRRVMQIARANGLLGDKGDFAGLFSVLNTLSARDCVQKKDSDDDDDYDDGEWKQCDEPSPKLGLLAQCLVNVSGLSNPTVDVYRGLLSLLDMLKLLNGDVLTDGLSAFTESMAIRSRVAGAKSVDDSVRRTLECLPVQLQHHANGKMYMGTICHWLTSYLVNKKRPSNGNSPGPQVSDAVSELVKTYCVNDKERVSMPKAIALVTNMPLDTIWDTLDDKQRTEIIARLPNNQFVLAALLWIDHVRMSTDTDDDTEKNKACVQHWGTLMRARIDHEAFKTQRPITIALNVMRALNGLHVPVDNALYRVCLAEARSTLQ
jgi:hypothetical protein